MPSDRRLGDIAAGQTLTPDSATARIELDAERAGGHCVLLSCSQFQPFGDRELQSAAGAHNWFAASGGMCEGCEALLGVGVSFRQFSSDAAAHLQAWLA